MSPFLTFCKNTDIIYKSIAPTSKWDHAVSSLHDLLSRKLSTPTQEILRISAISLRGSMADGQRFSGITTTSDLGDAEGIYATPTNVPPSHFLTQPICPGASIPVANQLTALCPFTKKPICCGRGNTKHLAQICVLDTVTLPQYCQNMIPAPFS